MPRHDPTEKTKSEILETSVRLFREKGWENVNIEDIVKEVGVTRGAFYHYFKSREELVSAVMYKVYLDNNPFIIASKEKGLNALEKLRLGSMMSLDSEAGSTARIGEIRKIMDDPVTFKSEVYSQVNTIAPFIEKLLEEGNEDGSISIQYPKQAAQVIAILSNLWLNPFVFQVSYQEFADKIAFIEHFAELMGISFLDNEIKEKLMRLYENCKQN